jgi:integrase/recombinase XerD
MFDYDNKDLLDVLLDSYGEHLHKQGKSQNSILAYQNPSRKLIRFLKERGIAKPKQITEEALTEFQVFLYKERDFSQKSVTYFMNHIKKFFDFLILAEKLKENPAERTPIFSKPEPAQRQLAHFYTFEEILRRYLNSQEKWISFNYVHNIEKHLKGFIKYLLMNDIKSIYSIAENTLLKYRDYLWEEFAQGRPYSLVVRSQIERLRCVVRLFRYLVKEGILKEAPSKNLNWQQHYKDMLEKAKSLPEKPAPDNNLTYFDELKQKFLDYELAKGKSHKTTIHYKKGIGVFFEFLKNKGINNLAQVNKRQLLEYYTYLCNYIGTRGKPVSNGFKAHMLWAMRLFFRFLVRFDYLSKDPSLDLEPIKEERGLPRSCMNEKEVFSILEQPRLNNNPLNIRDKAIMEVLFSTGIRSNELCQLNLEDVDQQQEMLRINHPKGGASFQRIIPIGRVALDYLSLYLKDARPKLENGDSKALFVSYKGTRLHNEAILRMVKKYAFECGLRKYITTHSFRVTCATLMLKNGADIRYVQEQLGHKRINSTQIYTRLTPLDLKSIHQKCHPREKKFLQGSKVDSGVSAGVLDTQLVFK